MMTKLAREHEVLHWWQAKQVSLQERVYDAQFVARAPEVFAQMFGQELPRVRGLAHPNIVPLVSWQTTPTHSVTRFAVGGSTLQELLSRFQSPPQLSAQELLAVGIGVCSALLYAHDAKDEDGNPAPVIHGTLRPEAIVLATNGDIVLSLFGEVDLLKLGALGEGAAPFPYLPPTWSPEATPTVALDVYAFGALMCELALLGVADPPTTSGLSAEQLHARRPDLPPALCGALVQCLAPEASERPEGLGGMREGLIQAEQSRQSEANETRKQREERLRHAFLESYDLQETDDESELAAFLSKQYGVPCVNLADFEIDTEVIELLPRDVVEKHQAIPLSRVGNSLVIAMVDPSNIFAIDDVKFITGYDVHPVVTTEPSFEKAVELHYALLDAALSGFDDGLPDFDYGDEDLIDNDALMEEAEEINKIFSSESQPTAARRLGAVLIRESSLSQEVRQVQAKAEQRGVRVGKALLQQGAGEGRSGSDVSGPSHASARPPGVVVLDEEEVSALTSLLEAQDASGLDASLLLAQSQESAPSVGRRAEPEPPRVLQRKGVVRYYEQMNPHKHFPLLVSIIEAQSSIAMPTQKRVAQTTSEKVLAIEETSPYVRIVPVIPGCLISPAEMRVDVRAEKVDAKFWVTPLLLGDCRKSACVQLWLGDELKDEIPIPTRIRKQTMTKISAACSLGSSALKGYTKVAKLGKLGSAGATSLAAQSATQDTLSTFVQGALQFIAQQGFLLGIAFLCATVGFYLLLRPRQGDPIERFFDNRHQAPSS